MQNETTTLQSQLVQLRFKLLQPGPPLTQAHSVTCESEGRVTAKVELCNPWHPEACNGDVLLAHLPKNALAVEEPGCARKAGGLALRWRSSCRRSMASGSPPSRRRAVEKARWAWLQRRCSWPGDAVRWCRRQRHRAVQGARACAFATVALSQAAHRFSQYTCSRACLTGENWQMLSTIGQWVTSEALPFSGSTWLVVAFCGFSEFFSGSEWLLDNVYVVF